MSVKMVKNSNSGGENIVGQTASSSSTNRSLLSLNSNIKTTSNADKEKNLQQKKQENGHDELKKKHDEKTIEKSDSVPSTSTAEVAITLKPGPKSKKERDLKLLKEKEESKNVTTFDSVNSTKSGITLKPSSPLILSQYESKNAKPDKNEPILKYNTNESPNSKSNTNETPIIISNTSESPNAKHNKNEKTKKNEADLRAEIKSSQFFTSILKSTETKTEELNKKKSENESTNSKFNKNEAPNEKPMLKSDTNESPCKSNKNETEKTKNNNEIDLRSEIKSSQSFTSNLKSTETKTKDMKKKLSDSEEEMECLVYTDHDPSEGMVNVKKLIKNVDSRNDKLKPSTFSSPENSPSKQTKLSFGNLKSNTSLPITSTPEGNKLPINRPPSSLRAISGRRSLHPSKEHSFQSQYRESYRKINTDLDYTNNTSLNVTVGSESAVNDSNLSFSLWGRGGRKRDRTPPLTTEHIEVMNIDSPKRARLDISTFLGMVASPVTMLRNRLSRTTIQSPTANNGVENLNDKIIETVIIEDQGDEENSKQSGDLDISIKTDDEPISNDSMEEEKNPKNLEEFEVIDDDDECEVVVKEVNKRKMCSIM